MKTYINAQEAAAFTDLESKARSIENALQEMLVMVAQSKLSDADKLGALRLLNRANGFFGASYLLHPQSEWQGGETWKIVKPDLSVIS